MKLLVDECCPAYLVEALRTAGHDVIYIPEENPSLADEDILQQAFEDERIIITEDHDFSELVFRQQQPCIGLVFIRIPHTISREQRSRRVCAMINDYSEKIVGAVLTITPDAVRIRAFPEES